MVRNWIIGVYGFPTCAKVLECDPSRVWLKWRDIDPVQEEKNLSSGEDNQDGDGSWRCGKEVNQIPKLEE